MCFLRRLSENIRRPTLQGISHKWLGFSLSRMTDPPEVLVLIYLLAALSFCVAWLMDLPLTPTDVSTFVSRSLAPHPLSRRAASK